MMGKTLNSGSSRLPLMGISRSMIPFESFRSATASFPFSRTYTHPDTYTRN